MPSPTASPSPMTVYCRVKPPEDVKAPSNTTVDGATVTVKGGKAYAFDGVFTGRSPIPSTYFNTLIQCALLGGNATLVTYGQAGTGKTFTVASCPPGEKGVAWTVAQALYSAQEVAMIRCSYSSLRDDQTTDLFATCGAPDRHDPDWHTFDSFPHFLAAFVAAQDHRPMCVAQSSMFNDRSHICLRLEVTLAPRVANRSQITGRIAIWELAGYEHKDLAKGRSPEDSAVQMTLNRSLLALGSAIHGTGQWNTNPLTRRLHSDLAGGIALFVVTIDQDAGKREATAQTLYFGSRVRQAACPAAVEAVTPLPVTPTRSPLQHQHQAQLVDMSQSQAIKAVMDAEAETRKTLKRSREESVLDLLEVWHAASALIGRIVASKDHALANQTSGHEPSLQQKPEQDSEYDLFDRMEAADEIVRLKEALRIARHDRDVAQNAIVGMSKKTPMRTTPGSPMSPRASAFNQMEDLKQSLATSHTIVESLRNEVAVRDAQLARKDTLVSTLRHQLEACAEEKTALAQTNNDLSSAFERLQTDHDSGVRTYKSEIASLQAQLETCMAGLDVATQELLVLRVRVAELQDLADTSEAQCGHIRAKESDLSERLDQALEAQARAERARDEEQAEVVALSAEVQGLQSSIRELQESLAKQAENEAAAREHAESQSNTIQHLTEAIRTAELQLANCQLEKEQELAATKERHVEIQRQLNNEIELLTLRHREELRGAREALPTNQESKESIKRGRPSAIETQLEDPGRTLTNFSMATMVPATMSPATATVDRAFPPTPSLPARDPIPRVMLTGAEEDDPGFMMATYTGHGTFAFEGLKSPPTPSQRPSFMDPMDPMMGRNTEADSWQALGLDPADDSDASSAEGETYQPPALGNFSSLPPSELVRQEGDADHPVNSPSPDPSMPSPAASQASQPFPPTPPAMLPTSPPTPSDAIHDRIQRLQNRIASASVKLGDSPFKSANSSGKGTGADAE